jgi:hypothetical protein
MRGTMNVIPTLTDTLPRDERNRFGRAAGHVGEHGQHDEDVSWRRRPENHPPVAGVAGRTR